MMPSKAVVKKGWQAVMVFFQEQGEGKAESDRKTKRTKLQEALGRVEELEKRLRESEEELDVERQGRHAAEVEVLKMRTRGDGQHSTPTASWRAKKLRRMDKMEQGQQDMLFAAPAEPSRTQWFEWEIPSSELTFKRRLGRGATASAPRAARSSARRRATSPTTTTAR